MIEHVKIPTPALKRKRRPWFAPVDLLAIVAILAIGAFLIGHMTQGLYLETGYQDWIFHQFRIESLNTFGVTSWDHIWSNGINLWRSYQFLPHLIVLGVAKITSLSLPQAMIWTVVGVFLLVRVEIYLVLRWLRVAPLYAFFATIMSYAFIQQWIALKDFSIFMAMPMIPVFIYVWIQSMKHQEVMPLMSAFAGTLWMFHPVLGYSAAGLFAFALFFPIQKLSLKQSTFYIVLYLLTAAAFIVPYLSYGYSYANPIFRLAQFLRDTLERETMGLSSSYWFAVILSWVALFLDPERFTRWSKILLLYCMIYVGAVVLGQAGFLPGIINQLQISRGMVVVGFMLSFIFGVMIQVIAPKIERRFKLGMFAVLTAMVVTQAITISNTHSGSAVTQLDNPAQEYFKDKDLPTGSIFTEELAETSYLLLGKVRFPNSYNEHLEPHPLAQRYRRLMKTDVSYSSLSQTQINLINAYTKLLGVEYVFLPQFSPTVLQLTDQRETQQFELVGEVDASIESFAVLRSTTPIHYAYLADMSFLKGNMSYGQLDKPGIRVDAFEPWDAEVVTVSQLISREEMTPLTLNFPNKEVLSVELPAEIESTGKGLFIAQSYDPYWKTLVDGQERTDIIIEPTTLRFISLQLPAGLAGKTVELHHYWPEWYWPVHLLSFGVFLLTAVVFALLTLADRIKIKRDPEDIAPPAPFKPKRLISSVPVVKKAITGKEHDKETVKGKHEAS